MIELRKLTKKYSNCTEIEQFGIFDIDLKLPSKGLFTICGESGCGKTTLLNVLGLIDTYDSGKYLFDDKDISTLTDDELSDLRKNDIGFIFQDYKLFEKDTVYNNICSNFIFDEKEIDSLLELVDLLDYKYTLVSKLSGGQKQRIAIVRALIKQCKLVIADEPTGNLDEKTADEIMSIFKQISKDRLVLLVTHDEELAHKYADEIIFMDEGKIISNNYINVVPDQIKVTPIKKEKKKVNLYSFLVNNILNPKLKDKLSLFIMELFVLLISLFSFSIITISRPNVINQTLEQTIVKDDLNLMVFDDSGVITKGQKFVCLDDKVPTHKFYQSGSFSFERLSVNIYLNDTINNYELEWGTYPLDENDILISDALYQELEYYKDRTQRDFKFKYNNGDYDICGVYKTYYMNYGYIRNLDPLSDEYKEMLHYYTNYYGNIIVKELVLDTDFEFYSLNIFAESLSDYISYEIKILPSDVLKDNEVSINETYYELIADRFSKDNVYYTPSEFINELNYMSDCYSLDVHFPKIKSIKVIEDNIKDEFIFYVSNEKYELIKRHYQDYFMCAKLSIDNEKNYIRKCDNYDVLISFYNSSVVYSNIEEIRYFTGLFLSLTGGTLAILLMTYFKEIYSGIDNNKESIGIALTLGNKIKDIRNALVSYFGLSLLISNICTIGVLLFIYDVVSKKINRSVFILNYFSYPILINLALIVLIVGLLFIVCKSLFKDVKNNNITYWMKRGDE